MSLVLSPVQCARAASAYRALLRAQRLTFKGDEFALKAAHLQTRVLFHRFIPSASASRSPFAAPNADVPIPVPTFAPEGELTADKVDEHIAGAFEIAEFLRRNVVQGVKNDEGNFSLRIHDETERGDNESIRKARADIPPEIKNVNLRRKRRRKDADGAASPEANAGGCGGGDGAAKP